MAELVDVWALAQNVKLAEYSRSEAESALLDSVLDFVADIDVFGGGYEFDTIRIYRRKSDG